MTNENTTTTTETATTEPKAKRAKKEPRPKTPYPFPSKREILASQAHDDVVVEHLGILLARQTSDEQDSKTTKYRNARGFMSSHAVNGTNLCNKLAAGEELTEEEWGMARGIASRYGKQLAAHYREAIIEANPELQKIAEIFSAG